LRSALLDLENPILRVGHMAFAIKCMAEGKGIDDAFANALQVIAMQIYEEIQAISETREKLSHSRRGAIMKREKERGTIFEGDDSPDLPEYISYDDS